MMQEEYLTLTEKLQQVANKYPAIVAVQIKKDGQYIRYTYKEFYDYVKSIAYSLLQAGVKQGDKIAIVLENRPEWGFIYFAILLAGAVVVPLDPQSTKDDLNYFFADSASKFVFTSNKFVMVLTEIQRQLNTLQKIIVLDELPQAITQTDLSQLITFNKFFSCPRVDLKWPKLSTDDLAAILYTSGTTGKPKGVMLTHKNFYANFLSVRELNFLSAGHNVLSILPLHHSFPFMVTLVIPLFAHSTITYLASFKRDEILACMRESGVTILVGVPQIFTLFYQAIVNKIGQINFLLRWPLWWLIELAWLLRKLTKINLSKYLLFKLHRLFGSKLQFFACGGAKIEAKVELFLNKLGFTVIQGYGLTETAPIVTLNLLRQQKIGSAGKLVPGVAVKIINPDAAGIGEVVIKGANVMRGYYQNSQATAEVLQDGWFYSGDLGRLDTDDFLFLTGRKKELIILSSGKNITPEEVESHYSQCASIKEMCVLEVVDKAMATEKLMAVIVPDLLYFRATHNIDVRDAIKIDLEVLSRNYPAYKHIMGFVITKEELPRTRLGKLMRHKIRAKYLNELMGITSRQPREEVAMNEDDLQLLATPLCQQIIAIITQERQLNKEVNLYDHLGIDLGYDSLSRVELITVLEKKFSLKITESLMAQIATVKELIIAIRELIAVQERQPAIALQVHVKENLWQETLRQEPAKTITDKIDIKPSWFGKIADLLFCGGLYIIAKLCWRVKIIGLKNLPKNVPFILCPNHASYLDAFLIAAVIPNWLKLRIFFLGYSFFFEVPIVRNLVKIGRIIPLDPGARLIEAMQACSYVLRNNKAMCIFPEGGRTTDGEIKAFKKGIGILAKELNIALVPVYIDGAFAVLPRGQKFPGFNNIKITFGKPCAVDYLRKKGQKLGAVDDYEAIALAIRDEVKNLCE